jgi:lysophospholipase L1-like esterase
VLAVVLLGSIGLNGFLLLTARRFYDREQQVRLRPSGAPISHTQGTGPIRVLFLGDSRIAAWPPLPETRYTTFNGGVSGETTAQILLRAEAAFETAKPQVVVIQAGINDLKVIGLEPENEKAIAEGCVEHLLELIGIAERHGTRIVFVPVLPVADLPLARRWVWSPRIEASRMEVNRRVAQVLRTKRDAQILEAESLLDVRVAGDYRDALHLKPEAYPRLQEALIPPIDRVAGILNSNPDVK